MRALLRAVPGWAGWAWGGAAPVAPGTDLEWRGAAIGPIEPEAGQPRQARREPLQALPAAQPPLLLPLYQASYPADSPLKYACRPPDMGAPDPMKH